LELTKRGGVHGAFGLAPGAVGGKVWRTFTIHDGLGHDGARGISSAQKQDFIGSLYGVTFASAFCRSFSLRVTITSHLREVIGLESLAKAPLASAHALASLTRLIG
jgi:hypothetical protein